MTDEHRDEESEAQVAADADASGGELYDRIEELGSGGVGTVWRARQLNLDRDVALKEINRVFNVFADVSRQDVIERFVDVVRAQAALVHPNIVQVLDVHTDAEYPFVVTQYAPGGNLRRLIDADERPSVGVTLKYFTQILSGLAVAHDAGLVHGNLKPENVVLDAAGNAMLSDFGLSGLVDRDDKEAAHVYVGVGTVAYMSPEQFQDPQASTVQTDIYSLGIMFYEMLAGKVPGRRSPMPSSFSPDIPQALDDIFDKMSQDNPEERYESVDQILGDLYGSSEVVGLFDRRAPGLFLRDPIEHGEAGGVGSDAAPDGGRDVESAGAVEEPVGEPAEAEPEPAQPADEFGPLGGLDEPSSTSGVGLEESSVSEVSLDESSISEVGQDESSVSDVELDESSHSEEKALEDEEPAADAEVFDVRGEPVRSDEALSEETNAGDAADGADNDEDDVSPDEVLDKLDKYGDMFE